MRNKSPVRLALPLTYLALLTFLSLNPRQRPMSTDSMFSPDKVDHAFAYGGLAALTYRFVGSSADRFRKCSACAWSAALTIAVCFGILIEIAQGLFTTNRRPFVGDAVANACGALAGYLGFQVVKSILNRKGALRDSCCSG